MNAFEVGIQTDGASGPLSFSLDARMFSELQSGSATPSYDREFVERQTAERSGSVAYASYSRFRSDLSYDWAWGRVSAARDALQWGPAHRYNLVFGSEAIPFHHLAFTSHLGPVTVQSIYGILARDVDWSSDTSSSKRTVFAHRYEWRVWRGFTLGLSEQLILDRGSNPFLFTPIAPLFILKAGANESTNNGNIAVDAAVRLAGRILAYSEFLVDDLQSPTSLFDDYWANKWAWAAGLHAVPWDHAGSPGLVLEYSRVEPWVYTHYSRNTSQAEHGAYPLGNRHGPNSQAIFLKAYGRPFGAYAGIACELLWKGTDPGSRIGDVQDRVLDSRKRFLHGVGSPEADLSLELRVPYRNLTVGLLLSGATRNPARLGILYRY